MRIAVLADLHALYATAADTLDEFDRLEASAGGPLFAAQAIRTRSTTGLISPTTSAPTLPRRNSPRAAIATASSATPIALAVPTAGHNRCLRRGRSVSRAKTATGHRGWTMIALEEDGISVEPRPVAFDREAHVAAIRATTMSPATQDRLCGFYA